MRRQTPYEVESAGFFLVASLADALREFPVLIRDRGALQAFKLALKVALGRCYYFGIASGRRPLTTGVLALGYCRFYPVSADSIVIGEIVTNEAHRGKGHATRAIMLAINAMVRTGAETFYVDTQLHNGPMVRSIQKLGFGPAVSGNASGSGS
jgi:RimJ/RimL family protein N-acetyltransferase